MNGITQSLLFQVSNLFRKMVKAKISIRQVFFLYLRISMDPEMIHWKTLLIFQDDNLMAIENESNQMVLFPNLSDLFL